MSDVTLFHVNEDGCSGFEDLGRANGLRYWMESDLQKCLDYQTPTSFRKVITRAMQACLTLGISCEEHFILTDGQYKLTRFACYLIAMNGDSKKSQVAAAQVYFAAIAETFRHAIEHAENIDRVLIRKEMTDGLKSLCSTAHRHGVDNFAYFQNAGYRGMYNMDLATLTRFKGLDAKAVLLDWMGKSELAANLFRITQTEEKIKNENLHGQRRLENAAEDVGRRVRRTMIEISGTHPEHLKVAEHIKDVKKKLKDTSKKFKKLDGKPKGKKTIEDKRGEGNPPAP